jgi:hypothetical protein
MYFTHYLNENLNFLKNEENNEKIISDDFLCDYHKSMNYKFIRAYDITH